MRIVSFKVAKAIKAAGYPPLKADWSYGATTKELVHFVDDADYVVSAPYAMEVWNWLWREKGIYIDIAHYYSSDEVTIWDKKYNKIKSIDGKYYDPEEAIIAAIEYLVEHKIIE